MKKIFLIAMCVVSLSCLTGQRAFAAAVAGALEPTQWLNNFELVGVNISDAATAISTDLEMIDSTIFRPLQTTLITIAQQQAADDILSWVNGGTEGDSLIISNPQKYIKDQGLAAVKESLKEIPVDSIYGNSIFSSIVDQYKDSDLKTQLEALSKSDIPSIIQENFCNDEALTSYAIESLGAVYSAEEISAKKTELYNYACEGDPETDPELATKLIDLNDQNPSVGGWDSWLTITGGENEYTRVVRAQDLEAKNDGEEKEEAKNEIYPGAGPVSQKKCVEEAPSEVEGEEPSCEEEEVLTPGSAAGDALSSAANSGLDRLTNLMEGGLTGLLTSLAISKLTSGLNSSTKSKGQPSTTVTTKSPPKQDLTGDAATKASITGPMFKQFENYETKLNSIETTDRTYLIAVNTYAAKIADGRACFDSLVDAGVLDPATPQAIEAYEYYDDRQRKIDAVRNVIVPEIRKIAEAKQLIADTKNLINNSNSTQEISGFYNDYTTKAEESNYPTTQTEGMRRAEYLKNRNDMDNDKVNIDKYQNMCASLGGGFNGGGPGGI